MNKVHSRTYWENYPSDASPLNERNLNNIEVSVDEIDNRVITLDTTKLDKVTAATMVKDVSYDESTGIFTVKYLNGATYFLDTKLEKLAVNFSYDASAQQLIITLDDGTVQNVDLSALITQYEFLDTDTMAFSIDSAGKVSAIVKDGSITEDKLQPNYLADIKVEVSKAQASEKGAATSEKNAASSAKKAESFAHGGTGIREGEDTDNAKYYSEQAKATYEDFSKGNVTGVKGDAETEYRKGNVNICLENLTAKSNIPNSYTNDEYRFSGNIDDLKWKSSGYYWVFKGDATGNQPPTGDYYVLEVISANSGVIIQKAYGFSVCDTYYRIYTNNKWYSWSRGISDATKTASGLMSAEDKAKLDDVSSISGTVVTGVKGNVEAEYRTGNVNITPDNIGALATNSISSKTLYSYYEGGLSEESSGYTIPNYISAVSASLKNIVEDYLPLSGGMMTGNVEMGGHTIGSVNDIWIDNMGWLKSLLYNKLDITGGMITGTISGNTGGQFGADGNVYINCHGYSDYLTNILDRKLSIPSSINTTAYNLYVKSAWFIGGVDGDVCCGMMLSGSWFFVPKLLSDYSISDNKVSLGHPSARWREVYAVTGSIQTSDRNLKDNIQSLTDKHLQFFLLLQPVSFTFKDGTSGRTHIGFISQDVEEAMAQVGLTDLDFAGFCKDIKCTYSTDENGKTVSEPILDENGNPEYIYSLRYEEFIAINTYAIQKLYEKAEVLEKENTEIKKQLQEICNRLDILEKN